MLGDHPWTSLADAPPPVVAVPVGSCEQHGPHLPLDTDTRIAVELAQRLAHRRPDVLIAPPIAIAASGEHQDFPGTLSIGSEVLGRVLVELVRSATWAHSVVIINGHGGNHDAIAHARDIWAHEARRVLVWSPTAPPDTVGDLHAGLVETSVMLALAPELVGPLRPRGPYPTSRSEIAEFWDRLSTEGVRSVSTSGVLGDPTAATAAAGARWLSSWADDLMEAVEAFLASGPSVP